ncbi:GlxA family transcriptional regulator [Catellatospora sp. KI3]|uniref:GlxA family transcriptional regulator n=1 Tax=Catellatospora sp. KI3 TaxID=3041620 RepID=UPI002483221E|nr:GlxA family transcriptional regulator [Catellatospora sp. KI3]MDI1464774.1 GlxA family transcriptional regulator [Catellatospora sp. KI3]
MSDEPRTGRIVVLVLAEVNLLDLSGPVQVFDAAAHLGADYRIEYAAEGPRQRSAQGLLLAGLTSLPPLYPGDLVLVPGPRLSPTAGADGAPLVPPTVTSWLAEAHRAGARIAAVCTGAAALGEAGLLNGRRCTTHWGLTEHLRRRYPAARVRDGALYIHDGPISTSAGISAGIDLALSLVERDHGPALTAAVARELVLYLRRGGDQQQLNPFLAHRDHLHPAVHRVQEYLVQHLDAQHTLDELAALACVSKRGLTRAFTAAIGLTPLEYQQGLRLELAGSLLAQTTLTVEAVAARCGFRDPRHFRRLFRARFGRTPSAARA